MIFGEFESLLKSVIGLNAGSIGASAVERAVRARLKACGLTDLEVYREYMGGSVTELQQLVEEVVIPETWFFRDREAVQTMVGMAQQKLLTSRTRAPLQLLSLPCSTGEEPYSIAMALLDAGVPADRFQIDAIDISARALAQAERAVYGKNSFRGNELGFRDRYFAATELGHRLADNVRGSVRFRHGNLFDAPYLLGPEVYDFIFCRNLLIYLDAEAQERAVDVLARPLSATGVLFVGPSEAGLFMDRQFLSARIPLAFAFYKATADRRATKWPLTHSRDHREAPPSGEHAPKPPQPPTPRPALPEKPAEHDQPLTIEGIRQIADQGRLAEAARRCEEHLREHEPSAAALHLFGLICDAMGNLPVAADRYRKALYLEPNHRQALAHLALLLEKQGDRAGAKVLAERMRRLDRLKGDRHA
jgi:chemotaxis protein methyltransferase WspC